GGVIFPIALISEALPEFSGLVSALGWIASALMKWTLPVAQIPGFCWSASFWVFLVGVGAVLFLRSPFFGTRSRFRFFFAALVAGVLLIRAGVLVYQGSLEGKTNLQSQRVQASGLIQLDVGQGDSALVYWSDQGHSCVAAIDLGSAGASSPSLWIRALSKKGFSGLDVVVLTHADEDHIGALEELLPWVPLGCVVIPSALRQDPRITRLLLALRAGGVPVTDVSSSCFPFPWVVEASKKRGANQVMAAVMIPMKSGAWYFNLGDSGFKRGASESALLRQFELNWPEYWLEAAKPGIHRVWKAPHHGSRYSSSAQALARLGPTEAWISAGWQNRYRHPHPETLARFEAIGARIQRTDLHGG
ncbi:hypothetical protein EBZ37_14615, partial [bacterium]|nr:hypothetical protein [bacterium]